MNHYFLGIHHVQEGPNALVWDLGFLAFGAGLALVGGVLVRTAQRPAAVAAPAGQRAA